MLHGWDALSGTKGAMEHDSVGEKAAGISFVATVPGPKQENTLCQNLRVGLDDDAG